MACTQLVVQLMIILLGILLQLSGAQLVLHSSAPECTSNCRNNATCRQRACQIPVNQEVNVTCRLLGECYSHMPPVSIHRIDAAGDREIRSVSGHKVMPGFVRLVQYHQGCWTKLTFIATADANNVVLQCAILHTHDDEDHIFSMAKVLSVREYEGSTTVSSTSAVITPSPTPSATLSSPVPPESANSDMTTATSTVAIKPTSSTKCGCALPTSTVTTADTPSGALRLTLHTQLTFLTVVLLSVLCCIC